MYRLPMARQHVLSTKVDDETVQRIDALAEALSERAAGVPVTRSGAHHAALMKGLEALEKEAPAKPKRKGGK